MFCYNSSEVCGVHCRIMPPIKMAKSVCPEGCNCDVIGFSSSRFLYWRRFTPYCLLNLLKFLMYSFYYRLQLFHNEALMSFRTAPFSATLGKEPTQAHLSIHQAPGTCPVSTKSESKFNVIHGFFYKKTFYKKRSLKCVKILRKS